MLARPFPVCDLKKMSLAGIQLPFELPLFIRAVLPQSSYNYHLMDGYWIPLHVGICCLGKLRYSPSTC